MKTVSLFTIVSCLVAIGLPGCGENQQLRIEQARSRVSGLAEELDSKTTDTGAYIRIDEDEIKDIDPWGTRIKIAYAQGGVAETITVRSAGPDREFHTADDIESIGFSTNLKGIGTGIAKHAEGTANSLAKGTVKGFAAGVKETIKDSFSKEKAADATTDIESGVRK
jgi:hypothetical protein